MKDFWSDIRYALRIFSKKRILTLAAILSLTLGIGANTAIFTLVNAFFLQPLPVAEPSRLVAIYGTYANRSQYFTVSYPDYLDYSQQEEVFSGMFAYQAVGLSMAAGDGQAERIPAAGVSGNYFDVLGVGTEVGRTFLPEEDDAPGKYPVAVMSHSLWVRNFGADPDVVGQIINLNRHSFTVIGVAAQGFKGLNRANEFDIWIPLAMYETVARPELARLLRQRSGRLLWLGGRLQPGVELAQARAASQALSRRLEEEYPDTNKGWGLIMFPQNEIFTRPEGRETQLTARLLLIGAVALVLLIACINVANLLLARAAERRREMAVRLAIGAGRFRLVRQLLTESALLGLAGGVLGLLAAHWGVQYLWSIRPPFFTENSLDLGLNLPIVLFTLLLSLFTGLLFGLAPALSSLRTDLLTPLRDAARSAGKSQRRFFLRHLTVILQVALCLVCLMGAGLFIKNLREAQRIDPGWQADELLLATIDLNREGYDEPNGRAFAQDIMQRLGGIPAVRSASLAEIRLLSGGEFRSHVYFDGQEAGEDNEGVLIRTNYVAANFLQTIGIPLLMGRQFNEGDRPGSPQVAIINQTMAKNFWSNVEDPTGKRIRLDDEEEFLTIVGVAKAAKYNSIREEAQPYIYMPFRQRYTPGMTLYLRTEVDPASLMDELRQEVRAADPKLPLIGMRTGDDLVGATLWAERMGAGLLSLFAVLALILAVVGIYGVISYSVQQRNGELGMRMALGARRFDVLAMILKEACLVVGLGLLIGLAATYYSSSVIAGLLYSVSPTDPATLVIVVLILAAISLLASFLPALRATTVDPARALRAE